MTEHADAPALRAVLRDGTPVVVRPARPQDRAALLAGFERLSPGSRYRRFLAPIDHLTEKMVQYLTEVDHHDHEALGAFDESLTTGVGVARYVRTEPDGDVAEAAVTVADDWQRRGLGTLLFLLLAARAREEGVKAFRALLLATNDDMMDLLSELGTVRVLDHEHGTVEVEVEIPNSPSADQRLRALLRASASAETMPPDLRLERSPSKPS